MTRMGVALLALMWVGPAWAGNFDAEKTIKLWNDAVIQCRQGETARQCQREVDLTILLQQYHCSFDESTQKWGECMAIPTPHSKPKS